MRALSRQCSISVACVMHDLNLAAAACDRIVMLKQGRVAAEGAPAEVIVPEVIERVFGARVRVATDPSTNTPYCLPR